MIVTGFLRPAIDFAKLVGVVGIKMVWVYIRVNLFQFNIPGHCYLRPLRRMARMIAKQPGPALAVGESQSKRTAPARQQATLEKEYEQKFNITLLDDFALLLEKAYFADVEARRTAVSKKKKIWIPNVPGNVIDEDELTEEAESNGQTVSIRFSRRR